MGHLSRAVVDRPLAGAAISGDALCVIDREDFVVVMVADGLGHGPAAAESAQAAVGYLEAHPEDSPLELLKGAHGALKALRGAALAIARIDRAQRMLRHVALGNVETRIVGTDRVLRPLTVAGIVGRQLPRLTEAEFPFHPGDLLLMHTDGFDSEFELSPLARDRDLQLLADQIARRAGQPHDDQLLLIVRDDSCP